MSYAIDDRLWKSVETYFSEKRRNYSIPIHVYAYCFEICSGSSSFLWSAPAPKRAFLKVYLEKRPVGRVDDDDDDGDEDDDDDDADETYATFPEIFTSWTSSTSSLSSPDADEEDSHGDSSLTDDQLLVALSAFLGYSNDVIEYASENLRGFYIEEIRGTGGAGETGEISEIRIVMVYDMTHFDDDVVILAADGTSSFLEPFFVDEIVHGGSFVDEYDPWVQDLFCIPEWRYLIDTSTQSRIESPIRIWPSSSSSSSPPKRDPSGNYGFFYYFSSIPVLLPSESYPADAKPSKKYAMFLDTPTVIYYDTEPSNVEGATKKLRLANAAVIYFRPSPTSPPQWCIKSSRDFVSISLSRGGEGGGASS
jgi:hypothetical protein